MMATASTGHLVMNPQVRTLRRDPRSCPNRHMLPRPLTHRSRRSRPSAQSERHIWGPGPLPQTASVTSSPVDCMPFCGTIRPVPAPRRSVPSDVHADDGGRTRPPWRPRGSSPARRPCHRSTSTVPAPGRHTGAGADGQSGASGRAAWNAASPMPWFTPPQTQSHCVSGEAAAQLGEPHQGGPLLPGWCRHSLGEHGVRRYQSRHPTAPVSSRSRTASMMGTTSSSMVTALQ